MISFLLLIFNNFQEQSSSRRAILADASQDAIMSLSVGTDSNLWLVRQDNQLLKLKLACLLFLQKLFFCTCQIHLFQIVRYFCPECCRLPFMLFWLLSSKVINQLKMYAYFSSCDYMQPGDRYCKQAIHIHISVGSVISPHPVWLMPPWLTGILIDNTRSR